MPPSLWLDVVRQACYVIRMIRSFRCSYTKKLFERQRVRQFASIEESARIKLNMLNAAILLTDLLVPPGNQLEALRGDRKGQHSIRVNKQWRICFVWKDADAYDVEITDYH